MFHERIKFVFINESHYFKLCKKFPTKVKQSLYMPITGLEAPRFRDSRHMKVVRLPILRIGRLYPPSPQEILLVLISVRDRDDPRAMVRPEGLC